MWEDTWTGIVEMVESEDGEWVRFEDFVQYLNGACEDSYQDGYANGFDRGFWV